jgi:hypothetical protein
LLPFPLFGLASKRLLLRARPSNALLQVFMNIVLDEAVEEKNGGEKVSLGMVV